MEGTESKYFEDKIDEITAENLSKKVRDIDLYMDDTLDSEDISQFNREMVVVYSKIKEFEEFNKKHLRKYEGLNPDNIL